MGNHGRALPERQALERACAREHANADVILAALKDLHQLKLAKLSDDLNATAALKRISDHRASLAAAQLAARLTQILRLDMDGLDELLTDLDGLPDTDTHKKLRKLADEAQRRLTASAV